MKESISPGAWRVLKLLSVFHNVSIDRDSGNALGAHLFQVYGPKRAMTTYIIINDCCIILLLFSIYKRSC